MDHKIVFNGREYSGVDEMPLDVREAYERMTSVLADADGDGTPDLFEGSGISTLSETRTRIVINGKEYSGVDQMPPDVRKTYDKMMARIDRDQNSVPDMVQVGGEQGGGMSFLREFVRTSTWRKPSRGTRARAGDSVGPEPGPETMDSRLTLALLVIIFLLLVIGALVALLFYGPELSWG
jgi:hypothetical protein